ncbi:MAG: DUF4142 domain-containing protein [Allosphingosinicella sp.]
MKIAIAAAVFAIGIGAGGPAAAKPRGAAFLTEAMQGDNSETILGGIAARRGASADVRRFGAMLASDHRKGKSEVAALARRMGVPVTDRMAPEAIAERSKLARLSGRAFDREFARYMIEDHRKDIAKFSAEAGSRDRPQFVALARRTLPVLHRHLIVARSLASR